MNNEKTNEQQDKTTYQTPEIIDYGSLETTTQSGGNDITDAQGASNIPT
jgi:hypothetical protein